MKEYHNGLYAVYTSLLSLQCILRILLTILMRYMLLMLCNGIHTRSLYQKLNVPCRKANIEQKLLSYVGPSLWNNLNYTLKVATGLNTFKHSIKRHYFNELKKKVLIIVFVILMF